MDNWREIPIYVIDFEGCPRTGVIEYGVVELRDGEIESCHTRLCAPQGSIDEREARLHGIRQQDTDGCTPFSDEWEQFRSWRSAGVFGAHHALIEHGLLKRHWCYPSNSPDYLRGGEIVDWGPWIDTRRLYENVYPGLETYQLMSLVDNFGMQSELDCMVDRFCPEGRRRAHCALYDALASVVLLVRLCKEPGYEEVSIKWLLEHSLSSAEKKQAARQGDLFE
ncbi:MAG: 3'-5' exonuclease [Verrucomicrobiota bacterium]